ncbi:hypothetical protein ABID22_002589 [Pontibacter aydingkolensis]|uniref:Outer membrane protein beta-barrel domain-containing protein n=1 Tax=Pontibacter aydingkolensis TaxID=1911536 RepID=A0ABS7CWL0_9BACT|nr:outer membrane beta-barrel protein [Pontibacter aydingkolensis]MBW7468187.1 hypothetical protein [Pontibacter aydingkolensis]
MKRLYLITLILLTALTTQAQQNSTTDFPTARPYLGMVEIGYLYGSSTSFGVKTYKTSPTVQVFNGYRFNKMFALGVTTGFDFYENVLVTPVALGLRGELLNSRISPIYGLDAGYGTTALSSENSGQKTHGGWMYSPAFGIRANTDNNTAFTFTVGYKNQRVETRQVNWNGTVDQEINYKRLTTRIGFMF